MSTVPQPASWKLVVHGGAGMIARDRLTAAQDRDIRTALDRALQAGAGILAAGGASIEAVTAAVMALEDDPHFNAGHGAVLTYDGTIELDAAIMRGDTRSAGSAAGMNGTRNPIELARAVMEHSPHVMLSGEGANIFSREQGLAQVAADYYVTAERKRQLEEMKSNTSSWFDADGHVATATSTGGITGKRWGRIGDSPIIGAGTYADDRACAVSATGSGEYFIRAAVAHEIGARIRLKGEDAATAAKTVLADVKALGGSGGVIVVSPTGETATAFNPPGMYRGTAGAAGRSVAIYGDE